MTNALACPVDVISAYIDGELDSAREIELEGHFAHCEVCSQELNQQKQFLSSLDLSLKHEKEFELPANFTRSIVANAESTVSGLRRPRERFNALFICAGLALFVLFAAGGEAGKLFMGPSVIVEQIAAVSGFVGHLFYSVFIGLAIIVRTIAAQFHFGVTAVIAVSLILGVFSLFVSRKVLQTRRA